MVLHSECANLLSIEMWIWILWFSWSAIFFNHKKCSINALQRNTFSHNPYLELEHMPSSQEAKTMLLTQVTLISSSLNLFVIYSWNSITYNVKASAACNSGKAKNLWRTFMTIQLRNFDIKQQNTFFNLYGSLFTQLPCFMVIISWRNPVLLFGETLVWIFDKISKIGVILL